MSETNDTPARPEGETERARQMLGSREFKVIGANERGSLLECEQCHAVVSASDIGGHSCPTPPARERGEEDDPEISRVVDRIALHASGRNCDCVDNTQCNAELDRATERAIEIVTRLTARLAELEQALRAERERVVRETITWCDRHGRRSGVRQESGVYRMETLDAYLARALAAAKGGANG